MVMRLEVLKAETLTQINTNFRVKVQLEEQLKENEVQLHFKRGMMEAFELSQRAVSEIVQADKIEEAKIERAQRRDNHPDNVQVKTGVKNAI